MFNTTQTIQMLYLVVHREYYNEVLAQNVPKINTLSLLLSIWKPKESSLFFYVLLSVDPHCRD